MVHSYEINVDLGALWVILRFGLAALLLLVFGWQFNRAVDWLHHQGYTEGYTWLYVVIGCAVTILIPGLLLFELTFPAWAWLIISFCAFACSGVSMAWGDIQRYVVPRKNHQDKLQHISPRDQWPL